MAKLNSLSSIFRTANKIKAKPKPQTLNSSNTRKSPNHVHQQTSSFPSQLFEQRKLHPENLSRPDPLPSIVSSSTTHSAYKCDQATVHSTDISRFLLDGHFNTASSFEKTNGNENGFEDSKTVPCISDVPAKVMGQRRKEMSRARREKLISISSTRSDTLIKRFVNLFGQISGTGTAAEILTRWGHQGGVKNFNTLIKVCLEEARKSDEENVVMEHISAVFYLLEFMKEKGFPLDERTYSAPLLYFIDMGMEEEFHFFSDLIKEKNDASLPKLGYYEMSLYIRVNKEEKIRELCHYILNDDIDEAAELRVNYLSALCSSDRKSDLLQLLDVIDVTKVSSESNLASIFKSLGRLSLESYAKRFLLALKEHDGGVDKISNLIFNYAVGAPNLAVEDVVSKFKNLHLLVEIKPQLKSYQQILAYCCKVREVHMALDVFRQMCEEGLTLSESTLDLLLHAIEDSFEYHLVRRIYSLIHDNDLKPTTDTFKMLISFCVKLKEFDGAYDMLNDVKKFDLKPTANMYNAIMKGYFREKNPCAALMVVNQMKCAGVEPDSQTYYYLISNCNCEKKINQYIEEMQHAEIGMTKHTYMALINAYATCGQLEKAKKVILDIERPCQNLNEIKSMLVSVLASHGQLHDALSIYEELKEAKLDVMPRAIVSLIEYCQSELDLDGLLKLLEEVQDLEYWTSCCSRVLSYCLHNKHLSSAIDLLKQLKDKFEDNELALEALFDETFATFAEMESPNMQFGMDIFQAIENEIGASPSRKCLEFLLTASIKAKDLHYSCLIWKKYQQMDIPYNMMSYLGMYQAFLVGGDYHSAKRMLSNISTGDHDIQTIIQACERTYPKPTTTEKKKEIKKTKKKAIG